MGSRQLPVVQLATWFGLKMIVSFVTLLLLFGGAPPMMARPQQLNSPASSQPLLNIGFNEDLGLQVDANGQVDINRDLGNPNTHLNVNHGLIVPASDCASGFWFNQRRERCVPERG